MTLRRLWPGSLAGQILLVVIVALLLGQGLALLIFADERREAVRTANREQVLTRTASLVRLLDETPPELHALILATSSSAQLRFRLEPRSAVDPEVRAHARNRLARRLRDLIEDDRRMALVDIRDDRRAINLIGFEPNDPATGRPRFWRQRPTAVALVVAVRLERGAWLNAEMALAATPGWAWPSLISLGLTAALTTIGVILAVGRVTRPMARLAEAADAFGRGEALRPLAEEGPADVRRTVQAFNRMQERTRRFVEDRTRMLAAIGHDLRTPITSLRLRAEFIEDDETRTRILATLDEMQRMVEATLRFAREEAEAEPTRVVDLGALLQSTVDDFADMGGAVELVEPGRLPYACRPLALRRALRNLIENALRYGERAWVRLAQDRATISIIVEDEGPGIPPDMLEHVFEPFFRLEASRSQETGGIGMGLAIARSVVRGHGGDVLLENRSEGHGLRAVIELPLAGRDQGP